MCDKLAVIRIMKCVFLSCMFFAKEGRSLRHAVFHPFGGGL